jgi:hypothetical protein
MRLSENFSLHEFLRSEVAARSGIDLSKPPQSVIDNLQRLCDEILEPLRQEICIELGDDIPLFVSSGWRPADLNKMIGGSAKSDHIAGLAADITAGKGVTPFKLCRAAQMLYERESVPLKQCILEFGQWTHVSVQPATVDQELPQFLTAYRAEGRTMYAVGLDPSLYDKGVRNA